MTLQEIMQKEVFNVKDIEVIFNVGQGKAYKIMRAIKSVSDRLEITGRVHRKDYEDYINRFDAQKNTLKPYPEKVRFNVFHEMNEN